MATSITLPTNELNAIIRGDLDILTGYETTSNGLGTIHIRNGGLYVEGLTDLDQTSINTTDGAFLVTGTNKVEFGVTSATGSIEMTAAAASFFTTTAGTLSLSATATDLNGKVSISAAGIGPDSILLNSTNTTSGQVSIQCASADTVTDAIKILASDTTGGNVSIVGAGSTDPAVLIDATSTTSGKTVIRSSGNVADAIRITANNVTSGGIDIDATGLIAIDTTSTASGITIATATAGVPVLIGTGTSVTTIAGDLIVSGTSTTINTETLTVEDNIILLNSGNGELGIDSGIVVRRFQTANAGGTGDVISSPTPIQESGAFQAGSATPGTLVLGAHASDADDFYNGWWIKVTSGTGIDQVRRIKDYVGSTKTVSLYVTADNTTTFTDGLDLVTAPAAADTYNLYSDAYQMSFYDESEDKWTFANVALVPDPVSAVGVSTGVIQQYQQVDCGAIGVKSQVYRNVSGSASTTTITFTLIGHGVSVNHKIGITDSADFTPAIASGTYVVQTVPTANTFTITVPDSTTSVAGSSATLTLFHTSSISVNVIQAQDSGFGTINIPGLSCFEDITIAKTSTAFFSLTECSNTYGSVMVLISDLNNTNGAFSSFVACRSTATNSGTVSRLASARGADGQRIDLTWLDGENMKIYHKPAGSGVGDYVYRVRVYSALAF